MSLNIQTIKDIKQYLKDELEGIFHHYEIQAITAILLRDVLKFSYTTQLALPETPLQQKYVHKIISACKDLKKGKPVQYILGYTEFYNCTIGLNEHTLIPRPETEELVDLIIRENRGFTGRILDVGAGSGCISIALAINIPGSNVSGFDISEGAIKKARENALINKARVSFMVANLFEPDPRNLFVTDIIVSNPPYIRESEKMFMAANVLNYEPPSALFVPDSDPMIYYGAVIDLAKHILTPGGKIYFEINESMGGQISGLMKSAGYSDIMVINDINNKERFIKAIRND